MKQYKILKSTRKMKCATPPHAKTAPSMLAEVFAFHIGLRSPRHGGSGSGVVTPSIQDLLRAEALAGAKEDDPRLSCSVLLTFSPDLPQIPCCPHAAPPRSFPFCFAGRPSAVILPLPHHRRAENCLLPQLKSQPRNRSVNASTYKEVWLDGTRPWLFCTTLSFPDCSRLLPYLAVVGCVSMVLLSVAAGARAGTVTVV